ncbi:unnamed protein product, partial [marine sediment metagenome]
VSGNIVGWYWANHFSTIGIIGMNEACLNLLGKDITSQEGREFSIRVLKFIRDKLYNFQEETGNFYNLEATPGEGASYRLAKIDKERFNHIITAGKNEPYYTNSSQLPVDSDEDLYGALTHQNELQTLYTGGTVFHCYLGESIDDPLIARRLVMKVAHNFRLPYFNLTDPIYF